MSAAPPFLGAFDPVPGFGEFKASSLATSMIISNLLNWGLLGILSVQVYTYYLAFPKDRLPIKLVVYFILTTQIAQTLISTRDAFIIFAKSFGNVNVLYSVHTLWLTYPVMGGIVAWLYQCYSGYRIYQSSRYYKIGAGIIFLLSTCGVVAAIGFGVRLQKSGGIRSSILDNTNFVWFGIWNITSAACDAAISGLMIYKLVKNHKNAEATLLVNRLIRLTVETGMLTAFAAIASVVVFLGYRHTPIVSCYFLVPGLVLGKLYGITLLAALNSRLEVVGGRNSELPTSTDQKITFPGFRRPYGQDTSMPPPVLIETQRSVWVDDSTGTELADRKKTMPPATNDINSIVEGTN